MSLKENPIPCLEGNIAPMNAATHDRLAARVRVGGLFFTQLDADLNVSRIDKSSDAFFRSYVLPQVQSLVLAEKAIREYLTSQAAASTPLLDSSIPGVILAIFPVIDRKQVIGYCLTAGKSAAFNLSEEVQRRCSQLEIDTTWLVGAAARLPGYSIESITVQVQSLCDAVRDQARICEMQAELDSLSNQLSNNYEELSLIYQVSSGMKVTRRPNDFFRQCCLDVMNVIDVRAVGVVLRSENVKLVDPAIYGEIQLPGNKLDRLADDLMVELRSRKAAILCNELVSDKRFNWLSEYARQMVAVPLMRDEHVLGCLFAFDVRAEKDGFDTVDIKLLTSIANESSIYLENAMLFDDVRGLMMGLLRSLTSAVDAKDAYTCGHSERVALLSRYIAQQAGLPEAIVERVYMAGLLHDVGKIGVPEAVLQKAGRLNPEEFEQVKKHPEIGARILRDVKQIQDIIPGVLHHHERYDGKGYPLGLAGDNISLMGRIICLADCFDAMTSSRTYRKALPLEDVLAEIRRCAGSQFDPVITEAFLKIEPEKLMELLKDHRQQMMRYSDASQLRVA